VGRVKLDSIASSAALASAAIVWEAGPDRYTCTDGVMTVKDVAKAAGCSTKDALRAMKHHCEREGDDVTAAPGGATVALESTGVPVPSTTTRAVIAMHVARKLGLGRFGVQKRVAEKAALLAARPNREKHMSKDHPWKDGKHGRSIKTQQGGAIVATLTCSRCPAAHTIRFRQLCGQSDMDRKFIQQGWDVDPAKCPDHNRRNHTAKETKPVPDSATAPAPTFAAPTPAAIAAQAKMFGLLQTHFDPETGVYGSGYTDAKIAEECRLSVDLVVGVRKATFGELKVPTEVAQLTADIEALEAMFNEAVAPIQSELVALKRRVNECCRKFGG
jgi:hypothetical protein